MNNNGRPIPQQVSETGLQQVHQRPYVAGDDKIIVGRRGVIEGLERLAPTRDQPTPRLRRPAVRRRQPVRRRLGREAQGDPLLDRPEHRQRTHAPRLCAEKTR